VNRHRRDAKPRTLGADRGVTLVEYVLVLSLIVLVALAGLSAFGSTLGDDSDDSAGRVVTAGGGTSGG
jgi:Flp pilus assembly pilin Flp